MNDIKELIKQQKINEACSFCINQLREDPLAVNTRALYIELLCLLGELEKADQQLDLMLRQHPDYVAGVVNLRQLIRAASARRDFYHAGMTASVFGEPDPMFKAQLTLRLALHEQDLQSAIAAATELESNRGSAPVMVNGDDYAVIRDLDDSLNGYLELFGTDGKFYLAKFDEIEHLAFKPAQSLLDTVWRRAEVFIKNGPQGEVFVPMTYMGSSDISSRLGRDTDWQQHDDRLVIGTGLKMLLVGDSALPLNAVSTITSAVSANSAVN